MGNDSRGPTAAVSRRLFIRTLAATGLVVAGQAGLRRPAGALAQSAPRTQAERLEQTMTELFGGRPIGDGAGRIKFEAPTIAENGAVVPVTIEVKGEAPESTQTRALYIIAERNPVPLVGRFTFGSEAARPFVATNIRLAGTAPVRAIAELRDGTLLQVASEVKVTIGGCGG